MIRSGFADFRLPQAAPKHRGSLWAFLDHLICDTHMPNRSDLLLSTLLQIRKPDGLCLRLSFFVAHSPLPAFPCPVKNCIY